MKPIAGSPPRAERSYWEPLFASKWADDLQPYDEARSALIEPAPAGPLAAEPAPIDLAALLAAVCPGAIARPIRDRASAIDRLRSLARRAKERPDAETSRELQTLFEIVERYALLVEEASAGRGSLVLG